MIKTFAFVTIFGLLMSCNESKEKKSEKFIAVHSQKQEKVKSPPPPPPPATSENFKCIYSNRYSDSARLQLYPFNKYSVVKLVSFRFHWDNLPIKQDKIIKDSLIEIVSLSRNDLIELTDVLYNNYSDLFPEDDPLERTFPLADAMCGFYPRNAIAFFDNNNQLKESIIFCFHCGGYRKSNKKVNIGVDCFDKDEKLRKLFLKKGVKFGTDRNKQMYPGETGVTPS